MEESYNLEKSVWSDKDFEQLGWHDATIYAFAFGPGDFELSIDIDYIFEWVHPGPREEYFRFWVAPCTLVFWNVYDLALDAQPHGGTTISVDEITRSDPRRPKNADAIGRETEWLWEISGHNGEITFRAAGFNMFVRKPPMLGGQSLSMKCRGGYSFAQTLDHTKSGA